MHRVGSNLHQHAKQHQSQLHRYERFVTGEVEGARHAVALTLFGSKLDE
jgi:hypothetical protein